MILTGIRDSSAFAERAASAATYPCQRKLEKRLQHIYGMDVSDVPAGVYSCAPRPLYVDFKVPLPSDLSFGIVFSAPAFRLPPAGHISSGMD
jgi:hypothetical protein